MNQLRPDAALQWNAEVVRATIDAWRRGDWDAVFKHTVSDVVFDNTRELGGVAEVVDSGDAVVSRQMSTFRGRDGIEVTNHTHLLWRLRDGAITRVVSYREFDDAVEAAEGSV